MPRLNEYTPTSEKSGYYIRANVGGSHPITLQVTDLARLIFEKTGYEPERAVPTRLVWAMYDLHLLYTHKSLDIDAVSEVSTGEILQDLDLDSTLSETERTRLISYIHEYEGEQKSTLTRLKRELERSTAANTDTDVDGTGANEDTDQSAFSMTLDEAISHLYMIAGDVNHYRRVKGDIDRTYLMQSLRTFIPHPYADTENASITGNNLIEYPVIHPERGVTCLLTDYRRHRQLSEYIDADYSCRFTGSETGATGYVNHEWIVAFTPTDNGQYDREEFRRDLTWILPRDPVKLDEPVQDDLADKDHLVYDTDESTIIEYRGKKATPCKRVSRYSEHHFRSVEVVRISNNGNPVINIGTAEALLDEGEPGHEYVAEKQSGYEWRAISEITQ
ncbi:hypothetical protein [Halococcus sediminicola]|uniref:hypothetical protein n=1 Tax=Halococcus sediminicola TaxID=1264579 RepID=UPI0006792AA3|nr:hypothetical protein [Halococcus sediminicola]